MADGTAFNNRGSHGLPLPYSLRVRHSLTDDDEPCRLWSQRPHHHCSAVVVQHNDFPSLAVQSKFRGSISSCFEPHLHVYVDLEERTLMETLDKLIVVRDSDCTP